MYLELSEEKMLICLLVLILDFRFLIVSDRTRPISIFVPGLADVALREEKRTDAIITTGIAQGDSNL